MIAAHSRVEVQAELTQLDGHIGPHTRRLDFIQKAAHLRRRLLRCRKGSGIFTQDVQGSLNPGPIQLPDSLQGFGRRLTSHEAGRRAPRYTPTGKQALRPARLRQTDEKCSQHVPIVAFL